VWVNSTPSNYKSVYIQQNNTCRNIRPNR